MNRVPRLTPAAPSSRRMSAAAMPRPSKMPPDATTGMGHRVNDLRHQRHGTDVTAIAAGSLAALRADRVGAPLSGLDGLRNRRDLHHYARPDIVGLAHQIARVGER